MSTGPFLLFWSDLVSSWAGIGNDVVDHCPVVRILLPGTSHGSPDMAKPRQGNPQPMAISDSTPFIDAPERYERGLALRKAGLFTSAIEEFHEAAEDRRYALKAHAQIGLCWKSCSDHEKAVVAFRKALASPHTSIRETIQILYVLGRTLETVGRIEEALEAYRWIRRENPSYRDVEQRILQLSTRRTASDRTEPLHQRSWVGGIIRSCQEFLGTSH